MSKIEKLEAHLPAQGMFSPLNKVYHNDEIGDKINELCDAYNALEKEEKTDECIDLCISCIDCGCRNKADGPTVKPEVKEATGPSLELVNCPCDIGGVCAYHKPQAVEEWPKVDEVYWWIDDCGAVSPGEWDGDRIDFDRRDFMGIFKTESEAQQALEKIKLLLKK